MNKPRSCYAEFCSTLMGCNWAPFQVWKRNEPSSRTSIWHEWWCTPIIPALQTLKREQDRVSLTAPESGIWNKTSTTALKPLVTTPLQPPSRFPLKRMSKHGRKGFGGVGQSQTLPAFSQPPMSLFGFKIETYNLKKETDIRTGETAQPFGSQHHFWWLTTAPPVQGIWCPLLASSHTWYIDT